MLDKNHYLVIKMCKDLIKKQKYEQLIPSK